MDEWRTWEGGYPQQKFSVTVPHVVSSPDLIRRIYRFQYNTRDTESNLRWGWFFGSGTETMPHGTEQMKHADLPNR